MPLHLHIDPFNGLAGDMLLAALVDLGAPPSLLEIALRGIPFPGAASLGLSFPELESHGVRGRRLEIRFEEQENGDGGARYAALRGFLEDAPLEEGPRKTALAVLERLGTAEAHAHKVPLDDVHFHELGGFDTLIDLVGVALALDALSVDEVTCGTIPLSQGKIRCKHGVLPCPAPATVELLQGAPVQGIDVEGEIVTPTGAALAVTLARFAPPPAMTLRKTAAGFGRSTFAGRPNCLRLFLGETAAAPRDSELLWLLEANLDDLPAEILATLPDLCLREGARDAWLSPALMKKGRPAHVLHALCTAGSLPRVQEAFLRHSSTLGVRRHEVRRDALVRSWEEVETGWGTVRVKIGWLGGEAVNRAPEFEDCRKVAETAGIPLKTVYAAALAAGGSK